MSFRFGSTPAYKHPLILRPHLEVKRKEQVEKRTLPLGRAAQVGDMFAIDEDEVAEPAVLEKDTGLGHGGSTVSIDSAPRNGTATVEADNTLTYVPDPGFLGEDSFTYRVTDADGDTDTATATIPVTCNTCVGTATLSRTPPRTRSDGTPLHDLGGYDVLYGTTSGD